MKQLVVATTNKGKLREISHYLDGLVSELFSLADFPEIGPIAENGATFQDNALIKAEIVGKATGMFTLADDSGLEVEILGGRPGVHSARFAGEQASDAANNAKLLRELTGVPSADRGASFHCALVLWYSGASVVSFDGYLAGQILESPQGTDGFGYDPLFFIPDLGKTLAEISLEVKNSLSHRGRALAQLRSFLQNVTV
jgi:XTP/dITP diphosphohydrolase